MRYSNYIGVMACLLLIAICFLPWVYIAPVQLTITGFYTGNTNFGHPGLLHVILGGLAMIFFSLNKTGAKRANIFICTLNMAWSFRNFILLSRCEMGECPEKKYGIYLIVILSFLILLMSLLPRMEEIKTEANS